ncbi:MAG: immunity 8 family protein [Gemmatimonadaceae bacterium]|nr:immunity 8 family protein [Gemmatimonadaceae bacterium]
MRAVVQSLHSPDISELETFTAGPEPFSLLIEATIGQDESRGGEQFCFTVCNCPAMNLEVENASGRAWIRSVLLMKTFSYQLLIDALNELCARAGEGDWDSIARYISKYTSWEFEDFQS